MTELLIFLMMIVPETAWSAGKKAPPPAPEPTAAYECVEPAKKLLVMGPETYKDFLPGGRDHALAKNALCLVNTVYANGCLERKIMAYEFTTLESDTKVQLKRTDNAGFWKTTTKNAPFAVDLRKYYTRGSIYGYTFFDRDNDSEAGPETRVWSNFNRYWTPEVYGAHLVHENRHQRLAGAFGHWTQHYGSGPYAAGDLAEECIAELQDARAGISMAGAQFQEKKAKQKPHKPTSSACEEL